MVEYPLVDTVCHTLCNHHSCRRYCPLFRRLVFRVYIQAYPSKDRLVHSVERTRSGSLVERVQLAFPKDPSELFHLTIEPKLFGPPANNNKALLGDRMPPFPSTLQPASCIDHQLVA